MPYRSGLDVLSSGCGQGVLIDQLDGRTGSAWGVDWPLPAGECMAPEQILLARGEGLPFATGSFDVVFGQEALAGHAWPSLVLSELGRVLRPSGWLVLWESRIRLHSDAAGIALAMHDAGLILRMEESFDLVSYPAALLIDRVPVLASTYAAQAAVKAAFALDGLLLRSHRLSGQSWHLILVAQKREVTDG